MNAMRLVVAGVLVCVLSLGVRAEEKKDDKKVDYAKLLLGSWEAVKADPNTLPVGAVSTFSKDGKMKVTEKKDGKEESHEGTYTVDGNKFTIAMNDNKFTITIKKISETEMVCANDEGKIVEFKKKK